MAETVLALRNIRVDYGDSTVLRITSLDVIPVKYSRCSGPMDQESQRFFGCWDYCNVPVREMFISAMKK